MDRIDQATYKKIAERKIDSSSYANTHLEITGVSVSETESRKQLKGIENYLERKQEIIAEEQENSQEEIKYKESIEITSDGGYRSDKLLKMDAEQSKDINYLLNAHGFDPTFWELTGARNNIWNVYSKQDGVKQLYSSKISVKPISSPFNPNWIKETIESMTFKNVKLPKYEYNGNGKVVEINFADVHIGKFINELVSNGVYDTNIAVERYENAIDKAIRKISREDIKEIIYIVGQDYMNIDTIDGTTTKGTRQDMNDFYETIYKSAFACLVRTCEKLRRIAPLRIIYVKGNHDKSSTFGMACGLEQMYSLMNVDNVTVDSGLKQRKYVSFGDVLIGYGHGEEEKNRIFDCMQNDVMKDWHKKRKYFHLSHFHSESKKEKAGVIYQWLGSLSENCNWTWSSGFVGAEKKGHVFIYDEVDGLEEEIFIKA